MAGAKKRPAACLEADAEIAMMHPAGATCALTSASALSDARKPPASPKDGGAAMKRPASSKDGGAAMKRPASSKRGAMKRPASKGRKKGLDASADLAELLFSKLTADEAKTIHEAVRARKWVFSSACSGSGIPELAFQHLMALHGAPASLAFPCEVCPFKQRFLKTTVHKCLASEPGCLFTDITKLGSGSTLITRS